MNESSFVILNYYCDESCHLHYDGNQFMVIGYVSLPYSKVKRYKEDIKVIRERHKNFLEIKWTKLNEWNYPFYSDLVSLFFDREDLNFRAILVDKSKYIASKCGSDYDKFYYLMYYQLISHKLDAFSNRYNIYLDIKDDLSAYRIAKLKEILNVNMGIINKIQHIRSHESEFIQLCDLLIGSISYKNNNIYQQSVAKTKLIKKIITLSHCDLMSQTPKGTNKFNIFKINI